MYHLQQTKLTCVNTNNFLNNIIVYFNVLLCKVFLPNLITVLFGILAYRNIQQIAYRTVPLVRRELDKQLTKMVLVQVVLNIFALYTF